MRRSWRRWAHVLVIGVGLTALGWAVFAGEPSITCRGEEMSPGSVCAHSAIGGGQDGGVQTYDQRRAAAVAARPIVGGVGLLLAAFGAVVWYGDRRHASKGIGP